MDLAKSVTRGRLIELAAAQQRACGPMDPLCVALTAAAASMVTRDMALSDVVREAEQLLPASATPLERGMMMGAAIALALVPGK